ncbi:uncharacterized protein VNE69_02055 [Vairimorpha necatrix]|uniref:Uncharacterized protein n=1 Tax=Vairimorpha necatrix TaxID=6039 RepID=A0AAX4J9D4_9MICR
MRLINSIINISKLYLTDENESNIITIEDLVDCINIQMDEENKTDASNNDALIEILEYNPESFHFTRICYLIFLKIYLFGDIPETCKKNSFTLERENYIYDKIKFFRQLVTKLDIKNKYLLYLSNNENISKNEKNKNNAQKNLDINKFLDLIELQWNELSKFSLEKDVIIEIANNLKNFNFYKIKYGDIANLFNTDEGYTPEFFDFIIKVLIRFSVYSKKSSLEIHEKGKYLTMAINDFQKLYINHYEFYEDINFYEALDVNKDLIVQVKEILSYIDELIQKK